MSAEAYLLRQSNADLRNTKDLLMKRRTIDRRQDDNGGLYSGGGVKHTLSNLTTNTQELSTQQSGFEGDFITTVTSTRDFSTEAICAHMVASKKGCHDYLSHCVLAINETSVSQIPTNYKNTDNHIRILTEYSVDDVVTKGSQLNFAKNNYKSFKYNGATSPNGAGECANKILETTLTPADGNTQGVEVNDGIMKRCSSTNNYLNTETSKYCTSLEERNMSEYIYTTRVLTFVHKVFIPLTCFHEIFRVMPMVKNLYIKMHSFFHTVKFDLEYVHHVDAAQATLTQTNVVSNHDYCPIMITPIGEGWDFAVRGDATLNVSFGLRQGGGAVTNFVSVLYDMTTETERSYISNPERLLVYNECFTDEKIFTSKKIKWKIHDAIPKPRYLIIQTQAGNNGLATPSSTGTDVVSIDNSCFTPSLCMMGTSYTNMNILNGSNRLYSEDISNYNWQMFQELLHAKSLNGDMTTGMTSGQITEDMFTSGIFAFHVFKLNSLDDALGDDTDRPITFIATNNSLVPTLKLKAFLYYETSLKINVNNAQLTMSN